MEDLGERRCRLALPDPNSCHSLDLWEVGLLTLVRDEFDETPEDDRAPEDREVKRHTIGPFCREHAPDEAYIARFLFERNRYIENIIDTEGRELSTPEPYPLVEWQEARYEKANVMPDRRRTEVTVDRLMQDNHRIATRLIKSQEDNADLQERLLAITAAYDEQSIPEPNAAPSAASPGADR